MKSMKIIALSAMFAGALFAVEGLSVSESVGFESEYLYRGLSVADSTLVATVDASYKLYNGSLYASVLAAVPNEAVYFDKEVKSTVGYKLPVYGKFTADVGASYDWFTNGSYLNRDYSREIYAGVTYAGLYVNPAIYAKYDFDLKAWTVDVSGSYSWDLAKYGVANTSVDVGAHYAYISADDADNAGNSDSYAYYGANADVVYHFSKTASASVGARYASNNEDTEVGDNNVFWGFKLSAGF
jgi:hypothetical protein